MKRPTQIAATAATLRAIIWKSPRRLCAFRFSGGAVREPSLGGDLLGDVRCVFLGTGLGRGPAAVGWRCALGAPLASDEDFLAFGALGVGAGGRAGGAGAGLDLDCGIVFDVGVGGSPVIG